MMEDHLIQVLDVQPLLRAGSSAPPMILVVAAPWVVGTLLQSIVLALADALLLVIPYGLLFNLILIMPMPF